MDPIETYEHCGIEVKIIPEEDSSYCRPRDADSNLTTLFCSYPGYDLGDEELPRDGLGCTLQEWANEQGAIAIAPLFVYEHGGITMRAGAVKCLPEGELTRRDTQSKGQFLGDDAGWDTSMVGFAIITAEKWVEMMGDTPRTEEKFREVIDGEVGEYADWLEGNVYGYVVADDELGEDSCWGFIGDPDKSGCKEEANSAAEHARDLQVKETNERSEMAARDIVTVAA